MENKKEYPKNQSVIGGIPVFLSDLSAEGGDIMKLRTAFGNKTIDYLKMFVQLFTSFVWLLCLQSTDSYYGVYLFCGFAGAFCFFDNWRKGRRLSGFDSIVIGIFSFLFSGATVLANYSIFFPVSSGNMLDVPLSLLGGFFVAWNILMVLYDSLPLKYDCSKTALQRRHPVRFFFVVFGILAAIDFLYLVLYVRPGALSIDSIDQLNQAINGVYTNHHPFWHTIIIKCIVELGLLVFGNINAAVFMCSVCQLIFVAASFAYALATLYQLGVPRKGIGCVLVIYALMPYHIAFSVTMWKDVVFGIAVLVFIVALYRIFRHISHKAWADYLMLALASLGFCLWRTNGSYAFLATILMLSVFALKKYYKIILTMLLVFVIAWGMKGPLLSAMGVSGTAFSESLSIPAQQVARVITAGCELTAEEEELLSKIMDIEKIPSIYKEYISDPVKGEIAKTGDDYLAAHKADYLKLWIQLGLKYPHHYIAAYVEQTKGYWNGGYDRWIYTTGVAENDLGINTDQSEHIAGRFINLAFWPYTVSSFAQPARAIGFHVWILAGLFIVNLMKKREETWLAVPVLMVIATLLIATPVFSEFRYAYSVFTTLPFIGAVTVFSCSAKKVKTTDIQNVKEEDSLHE